jgi:glycerol uptake facilitator-like aquaporin
LNPAVTTAFWRRGHLDTPTAVGFLAAQITGAVIGVGVAHIAFGERILAVSSQPRGGLGGTAAEFVGTLLLVLLIVRLVDDGRNSLIPPAVGAWVAAMVLSTPSGGFLNPAVTLARIFSDTYTGIAPGAALGFVAAQVIAGIGAGAVTGRLVKMREPKGS